MKSSRTGGHIIIIKGRKSGIVQYCIANDCNYAGTSKKYQMSYQQARSYTIKYESGGVEALRDKHGKQKTPSKMSELGKLRAEMKILRGEKEPAEMEASFLKTRRNSKEAGLGSVRYDPYTMQSKKNVRSIIILSMHYAGLGAFQEPHTINGRTDRVWQINEKTRKLPR